MKKVIITAAICGAEVTKEHNENVPYTVEEVVREAKAAYDAGASIIHLHVRNDDGTPTQDINRFKECIDAIKEVCKDAIVQPSTGGAVGMSNEERIQPVNLFPEMATLDCGTCNFGGDDIFVNTENTIKEFGKKMIDLSVKPEIEVFDKGMVDMALRLNKKDFINDNMHFNFVMGVNGGISGTYRDLMFMRESIPSNATFTVSGVGRCQFDMIALSVLMGGHIRVGFEDNVYMEKGIKAKSNGELVEKAANIVRALGRQVATPKEAREILGLEAKVLTAQEA